AAAPAEPPRIRVGSKSFTESYILAEMVAQIVDETGEARAERRLGLGGTGIVYGALASGDIDIYPEYTGTIAQAILKEPTLASIQAMRTRLGARGLTLGVALGFDNTYALAVRRDAAARLGLRTIGDLARHPGLRAAFDPGFLDRGDGWPGLQRQYGLRFAEVRAMELALTYPALVSGRVDVIDVFSTDRRLADGGRAARAAARHPRRAPAAAGAGGADGRGRDPDDSRARAALVHDPALRHRPAAGARRAVPLRAAAHRAHHARRDQQPRSAARRDDDGPRAPRLAPPGLGRAAAGLGDHHGGDQDRGRPH